MKQLIQSLKTGEYDLLETPCPQTKANYLTIKTTCSLISTGTERMLRDFGKAGIIGKIKQQPEKVRQVIDKIQTDGLVATIEAVKSKLNQPISLGYCQTGITREIGENCDGFVVGDRVVSNGAHAEIVSVPKNLCVKIPDNVEDESAVFSILGAIALQGMRLAKPTLGECFAVIGLGVVGQLTVQLLLAQGCRVLGIDVDQTRCEIASRFGATVFHLQAGADPCELANNFSRQRGVDGVLITASTNSDLPVQQAATMCRQRGRIVLVGVSGLHLSRDDFFKKELSFQVSCSYGPGRYDKNYEENGQDYPIGFVRWTENRNIEAFLDMLATGKVNVTPLITHRFLFENAIEAYQLLGNKTALGILLKYRADVSLKSTIEMNCFAMHFKTRASERVMLSCIGAGNFASRVLIPLFKKQKIQLHTLVSASGINSALQAKKHHFQFSSTDTMAAIQDEKSNVILIATPHHLHAEQVMQALQAGKHVYVEKPLAITEAQLEAVIKTYEALEKKSILMVGFNRRFSAFTQKIKKLLAPLPEPKNMIMTVNAGFISKDHWTQNEKIGGGRLIGEACHFVDLLRAIVNAAIVNASITALQCDRFQKNENVTITLKFSDGSQGTIHYFSNGHVSFPKERLEIFCGGKILQCDNFRKLKGFGFSHFKQQKTWRQEKGHEAAINAFLSAVKTGKQLIPLEEIVEVTRICVALNKKAKG